jgi:hypothetical protein
MPETYSEALEEFCQGRCDSIRENFAKVPGSELILANCGDLLEDDVDAILDYIEIRLEKDGERKSLIKKIFTIVVESLQNIRIHGTDDREGVKASFIVIGREKQGYQIWVGNLTANNIVGEIKTSISKIKGLKPNAIRQVYLNSLSYGKFTNRGGGGLGLITIALKSDNKLQFAFEKINDNFTLFNLNARVSAN